MVQCKNIVVMRVRFSGSIYTNADWAGDIEEEVNNRVCSGHCRWTAGLAVYLVIQSAEDLGLNSVYNKRSAHIETQYHWVGEY